MPSQMYERLDGDSTSPLFPDPNNPFGSRTRRTRSRSNTATSILSIGSRMGGQRDRDGRRRSGVWSSAGSDAGGQGQASGSAVGVGVGAGAEAGTNGENNATHASKVDQTRLGEPQAIQEERQAEEHRDGDDDDEGEDSYDEDERPPTPLPKMQLFILCVMRLAEPVAFTVIFPFVNQQIHEVMPNIPKSQIGYYAGLVESIFALVQFCTVFLWGRMSDSIGRKPILILGLTGTFISTNAFGLARSFPMMIVARCINGLFNANVGVLKSVLGELTDDSNSARAFSLLPMMFALGTVIGPQLGGSLSHPAENFPSVFGDNAFLKKYPYYLPCGIASLYILFAVVIGFFFLEETLPSKVRRAEAQKLRQAAHEQTEEGSYQNANGHSNGHRAEEDEDDHAEPTERDRLIADNERREADHIDEEEDHTKPPPVRSLLTDQVLKILTTQMLLNLQNISFTSLVPLFCYEAITDGGVGFTNADIGNILTLNGIFAIIVQSLIFPPLQARLGGPLPTYRLALWLYLPSFALFPIAHLVALHSSKAAVWTVFALGIAFKALSGMAIVSATLLVNNVSPSRRSLGALNGLSQSFGSLSRAIGPTMSTSLFAFSSTHQGWGNLVWIVMIVLATAAFGMSWRISVNRRQTTD